MDRPSHVPVCVSEGDLRYAEETFAHNPLVVILTARVRREGKTGRKSIRKIADMFLAAGKRWVL